MHKTFSGKIIRKFSVEKNFISFTRGSLNKTVSMSGNAALNCGMNNYLKEVELL